MISLILIEFIAYFNHRITFELKRYASQTFIIWPLQVYSVIVYIFFGMLFGVLLNWMQKQKKEIPIYLLVFNVIIVMVLYKTTFSFPPLPLILIGYFFMCFIQKAMEDGKLNRQRGDLPQ